MSRPARLNLADVIDLELQLEIDRPAASDALRARDRAIGIASGMSELPRAAQLRAWLDALRSQQPEPRLLGAAAARGARLLAAFLFVIGILGGSGAARVLLDFDGTQPVNVLPVLGTLVLLQIGLLGLVLTSVALSALVPGLARYVPLLGDLRALLRSLAGWLSTRGGTQSGRARAIAALHRLRARGRLHAKLELWWMTLIAQSFGIAFNLGAIAMLALLPAVLKYSFCWSTTLSLGPAALHRVTSALALPWGWFFPAGVPSPQLIASTQFDLLTRQYTGMAPAQSSGWWPFLLAAVIAYGLLPRIVLALLASLQLRKSLTHLPLDTPDIEALLRRLQLPRVETRGDAPDPRPQVSTPSRLPPAVVRQSRSDCAVVAWRDLPLQRGEVERWLDHQFGWHAQHYHSAGGADFEADQAAIVATTRSALPIAVLAEAWEPPDKAMRHFLRALRDAAGPRTKLAVVLVHGGQPHKAAEHATDLETWSTQLAALEDPYLSVESMSH